VQVAIRELGRLMAAKEAAERESCTRRLLLMRMKNGYGPPAPAEVHTPQELNRTISSLRAQIAALDEKIAPLARRAAEVSNTSWGPTMWAGNDKSHFARQIERYADVYTSRVSNFAFATPFVYLRSQRGMLPHDVAPAPAAGAGAYATDGPATRTERVVVE